MSVKKIKGDMLGSKSPVFIQDFAAYFWLQPLSDIRKGNYFTNGALFRSRGISENFLICPSRTFFEYYNKDFKKTKAIF
ncbi:hypothetical protein [Domibacillus iocasae]|uniref:hypothetical protein n=1 Tax=Domibacillus iocasae TaxID=1714016 RepID=UPI00114CC670|nr:hypothetical protein [Domibacillus iocasae]